MCVRPNGKESLMQELDMTSAHSVRGDVFKYLALTFGISWVAWIIVIRLHLGEGFLYLGSAGPAFAAMILSRNRRKGLQASWLRVLAFLVLLIPCWIVLSLYFAWRVNPVLPLTLDPRWIAGAACPAWIISGAFSRDSGVRVLVRRLVHPPNRWSAIAFLLFPGVLLIGVLIARVLHRPL